MAKGASVSLVLDLGDVFTKGLARRDSEQTSFRFPSVVASRLVDSHTPPTNLLLSEDASVPRAVGFDEARYPRWRSYPGAERFARSAWRVHGQPVKKARFSGWLAAVHGADRELLGQQRSPATIDALVHRALIESAAGAQRADITLVVDTGPKAEALTRYASGFPADARFFGWTFQEPTPRRFELRVKVQIVDAAVCAAARLPVQIGVSRVGRVLLVDVGYFRTKLAVVSKQGCVLQETLDFGVSDCVRRILRDGQDQGLVEDEFAVIRALEVSHDEIEVAGRRYSIAPILQSAVKGLEQELANAIRRTLVAHYDRGGDVCPAVSVLGGGAALVGEGLCKRLAALELGLDQHSVDASADGLVRGAQREARHPRAAASAIASPA